MNPNTLQLVNKLLNSFRSYLSRLGLASASRKVYLADTKRFLLSLDESSLTPGALARPDLYQNYLKTARDEGMSPASLNRCLASLKKLGTFLDSVYSLGNPAANLSLTYTPIRRLADLPISWKYIKPFTKYLEDSHLSPSTIKSYKSDVTRYLSWAAKHAVGTEIVQVLTTQNIEKYLNHLANIDNIADSSIERKYQSLSRFRSWLDSNYTPNIKSHKNASYHQAITRDNELPSLRSFRPTLGSILAMGVILLLSASFAIFGYRQLSRDRVLLTQAYPSTPVSPNRQISFQGRLEDSAGTPINASTNLIFKLFTLASGGTELYSTGTCAITPDPDGVFSTQIGDTCGGAIASSVFTENADVWLEVTVGSETLSPRQQIATVAYALNAETLQGFPLSATVSAVMNTVVPMNQWGEIIIGEQNPRMTGVSGTFAISAPAMSITTTTGSSGNITLAPDGTGQVNVQGNTTSTNFFNVSNAQLSTGTLISGTVANNNTGFLLLDLLSGSSPTSKFSVSDAGNTTIAGTLTLPNTNTLTGVTDYLRLSQGLSVGGADTYYFDSSGGINAGTAVFGGAVTLSSVASVADNNSVLTIDSGVVKYIDTTSWDKDSSDDLAGTNIPWVEGAGILYPKNSTIDLLVGGQATASAKFKVVNIDSGTPTASMSATYWTSDGTLATTARQSLTIGNSATYDTTGDVLINSNGTGYLGIGTTTPTTKLTLADTSGGSGLLITGTSGNQTARLQTVSGAANRAELLLNDGAGGPTTLVKLTSQASTTNYINNSGNLGVGTFSPDARLEINHATGDNLRLTYNDADGSAAAYTDFSLASDGDLTIDSAGGAVNLAANDSLSLLAGTGALTIAGYSGTGNAASITSSSTTDTNKAVNIAQTGATTGTDYGLYSANTGAGTTNVAGYFTASGATNNYGLIVENGNAGIGTTSPGQRLVVGNITSQNTLRINGVSTADMAPVVSLFRSASAEWSLASYGSSFIIGNDPASYSDANLASSAKLTIDSTGRVGIGDISPTALLTVGNGDLFQVNSSGIIAAIDGVSHTIDDVSGNLTLTSNSTQVDIADDLGVNGATSADITSTTTTATVFDTTVTSLSLGSASTTLNLSAGGALTRSLNLGTGTGVDTINIGTGGTSADDINIGGLATSHTDFTGIINLAGGTTYFVDASGNTTLNAGTFAGTLTANGTLDANGQVDLGDGGDTITINGSSVGISTTGAGSDITLDAVDQIILTDFTGGGTGCTALETNGSGHLVCGADDTGGGGLWTDGTTYIYPTGDLPLGNPASAGANKIAGIYLGDSSPLVFGADNDISFSFSGSTLGSTLASGTRVGIGTTSALATLDIRSSLGTIPTASISGSSSMSNLIVDQTGTGDIFTASASGATRFVVKENGNVGIGVSNPTTKLAIGGGASTISNDSGDLTIDPAGTGGNLVIGTSDNLKLSAATNLIFGGTTSLGETTAANDSGAYLVGTFDEFTYSASSNVQDVLDDLDAEIFSMNNGLSGVWTDATSYLYPTGGEVLGNSASAGANKIAGIYLGDSSPLVFGADNDVTMSYNNTSGYLNIAGNLQLDNILYLANGTTYFVDASGNAKFLDLIVGDTANPGLTVGDGTTGYAKIGGSTISDAAGSLTLDSDSTAVVISDDLTISGGNITNLITFDSGLTSTGTLTANGAVVLGDNGDNVTINSNIWDVTAAGVASGLTGITSSGSITFSALTAGSIPFAGTGGLISQDNANFFWNDTSNYLGLGTASPDATIGFGAAVGTKINFYEGSNYDIGIQSSTFQFITPSGDVNGRFVFGKGTSASLTELLRIQNNGYVGVGTNAPNHVLDVYHLTDDTVARFESADDKVRIQLQDIDTFGYIMAYDNYYSMGGQNLLHANNLNINATNGFVGIGTVDPVFRLDAFGSGRVTGSASIVLSGSIDPAASTTVTGVSTLFTKELAVGDKITVTGETRTVTAIASNTSLTVDTAFSDNANDTSPDRLPAQFIVADSSNNVDMIVNSDGYVGIGTNTPGSTLDITGTINVSGTSTFGDGTGADTAIFNSGTGTFTINQSSTTGIFTSINSNSQTQTGGIYALDIDLGTLTAGAFTLQGIRLQDPATNDAGGTSYAINIVGANWDTDISLSNGETIDNATEGVINLHTGSTSGYGIQIDSGGTATTNGLCHSGIDSDTTFVNRLIVACNNSAGDLAEWYETDGTPSEGDIVTPTSSYFTFTTEDIDPYTGVGNGHTSTHRVVKYTKSSSAYDPHSFGIVTTSPYQTFGGAIKVQGQNPRAIALSGRVPLKISRASKSISPGDPITTSDEPGKGMKATQDGKIVAVALESWDADSTRDKINVYIVNSYYDPDLAINNVGEVTLAGSPVSGYTVATPAGVTQKIVAAAGAVIADLQAGIARIGKVETDLLSPLSGDIITATAPVKIAPSLASATPALEVTGEIVTDTLSARLAKLEEVQADRITARDIVADRITAGHIDGLDAKLATLSAELSDSELESITTRLKDRIAALTGDLPSAADIPIPPEATASPVLDSDFSNLDSNLASDSATLLSLESDMVIINQYLAVIGNATITSLDITGSFYTESVSSKSDSLAIQPMGGIVDLADHTLVVDSTGKVTVNGDLTVYGNLIANHATINQLDLGTPADASASSTLGHLLAIYNEAGVEVGSIDASGSANLASVTTKLITIASSGEATPSSLLATETSSNATAGNSILVAPNTELTIESPFVTAGSLVYLTPTGETNNKVLFVKAKTTCSEVSPSSSPCTPSFTVGVDSPAPANIPFNWWIIELH